MSKYTLVLVLIVLALLFAGTALAQGASPAEPTIEPFLQGLVDYINQATAIAEIAALALILTQLLKVYVFDRFVLNADGKPKIPSAVIHISVQVVLWGGHLVAVHFGVGAAYIEFGQRAGEFLMGIRGILIPATLSVIAADVSYKKLHQARISGFRHHAPPHTTPPALAA